MRNALVFTALLCPLLFACAADPVAHEQPRDTRPRALQPPPANTEALRRLDIVVSLKAGEYTLDDIAGLIEREAGLTVRFDWDGLEAVGVTADSTVAIKPGTAPAQRVLSNVLYLLSPVGRDHYPTYMLVDGTVVVGTNRSLVQKLPQVNWPTRGEPGGPAGASDAALQRLQKIVTINVEDVPFENAIGFVQDTSGHTIEVNWQALQDVGIFRDTEVDLEIDRGTIDELLRQMLNRVSTDTFDDDKAGYIVHQGRVIVSTLGELKNCTVTQAYDVRDLIERPYGPTLASMYLDDPFALALLEQYDLIWRIQHLYHREPDFHTSKWATAEELEAIKGSEREVLISYLEDLLSLTVGDPDEWLDEISTMTELNGNLLIKTREDNHRQINQLLSLLREARRGQMLRFAREVEAARLLREAELSRKAGDHEQARKLADQAHRIDPGNLPARALREVMEQMLEAAEEEGE